MIEPECKQSVPSGFLDALTKANKFRGRGTKLFPWLGFVELAGSKLYASDNCSIVEIDVGADLGSAVFTARDVTVLKAMGGEPVTCDFHDGLALTWADGRWFTSETQANTRLSESCRPLIEKYWRKGRPVPPIVTAKAKQARLSEVVKFAAQTTGEKHHQYWYGATIAKVMSLATFYDPEASPASFSFPNGKGLIVKPLKGRINL